MKSIISQIRAEAISDADGQMRQTTWDEGFYEGQQDAWRDAPSRLRWFLLGAALASLVWWLA